ncbi:MAG TPA: peptidoglycan recognition family protein [Mycobacteriales bacterium]|nr:peptidoglycan recognition family protein [Mycobacteriales bacterium]
MSKPTIDRRGFFRAGAAIGAGAVAGATFAGSAHAAAPAVDQPYIAGCDEWGARPPSSPVTVISNRPVKIIVHHTALENSTDYSQEHAFAMSREIQDLHMDQNGWLDTGQQFTNSRGGWITEGRHGSLDALLGGQTLIEGAQCVGQNDVSIGIENEGNYVDVDPPDALYQSLIGLCAFICQQYGIAATEIYGHQDFNNTQCPGRLEGRLPDLRNQVAALLN